jgi:hypothetical protein
LLLAKSLGRAERDDQQGQMDGSRTDHVDEFQGGVFG